MTSGGTGGAGRQGHRLDEEFGDAAHEVALAVARRRVEGFRGAPADPGAGGGELVQLVDPALFLALGAGGLLAGAGQRVERGPVAGVLGAELPGDLGDQGDRFVDGERGPLEVDVGEGEGERGGGGGGVLEGAEEEPGEQGALAHAAHAVDQQRGFLGVRGRPDVAAQLLQFLGAPAEGALDQALERLEQPGALQQPLDVFGVGEAGRSRDPREPQQGLEGVGEFVDALPLQGGRPAVEVGEGGPFGSGALGDLVEVGFQDEPGGSGSGEAAQRRVPDFLFEGPGGVRAHAQRPAFVDEFEGRGAGRGALAGQPEPGGVEPGEQAGGFAVRPAGVRYVRGRCFGGGEQFGPQAGGEGLARAQLAVEADGLFAGRAELAHVAVVAGAARRVEDRGDGHLDQFAGRGRACGRGRGRGLLEERAEEPAQVFRADGARGVPADVFLRT
ncbi:hypothetical protein GCM10020254_11530 [Streptomyces goshikiensis]